MRPAAWRPARWHVCAVRHRADAASEVVRNGCRHSCSRCPVRYSPPVRRRQASRPTGRAAIARGGATRLAGALLANAAASAAASPGLGAETFAASNSAAFGREANIALWTHALTLGPALARQASRLPPPPCMQAMTIGLPTVLRQFSMAWLSSRACAGATAKRKERTVAPPTRAVAVMKCSLKKIFDFETGFGRD